MHLSIRATFHTTPFSAQQLNASLSAQQLNASLSHVDPEIFSIIENEKIRQRDSVVLIPSEVYFDTNTFDTRMIVNRISRRKQSCLLLDL